MKGNVTKWGGWMLKCEHPGCKELADFYVQHKTFSFDRAFICYECVEKYVLDDHLIEEIIRFEMELEEDEG